ncbi:MAG: bifunctional phosphoribosylaminoimidazolecarboxamide formyltransferase/IMP cyclohydrolase [Candidatus Methanolliviera sp. GoM_oil]|nr:MAG: bifunctional phosphoribosylaminoimidazolecarboxamide formyltransferase/IMP cyclohydrolase [Candidatus Methanolliviera sp. GoM_oil]
MKIKSAILNTWNNKGMVEFAEGLLNLGIEVRGIGETAKLLSKDHIKVKDLPKDSFSYLYEMLDSIEDFLFVSNLEPIDPLKDEMKETAKDFDRAQLIKLAAKNYDRCAVLIDPEDYKDMLNTISKGELDLRYRRRLASKALNYAIRYEILLSSEISDEEEKFPDILNLSFKKAEDLRYGENYHQKAAFYINDTDEPSIASAKQIHGKELSYNNIMDANNAIECVKEFDDPTIVIMKHATPTGIASSDDLVLAWRDAFATDIYSPFGGIVSVNRELEEDLAEDLSKLFLEVVIAPSFKERSIEILGRRKNLILLEVRGLGDDLNFEEERRLDFRSVSGGLSIQERDDAKMIPDEWKVVTDKRPSREDIESMVFGFKCAKWVRSNAIVFVKEKRTVGIGGGQTSRVDSSWIATQKGKGNINDSIMASDAFFPFRDAIDVAKEFKIRGIVQPGGSIRDNEVIEAANEYGVFMVFTGQRCFRH